MESIESWILHTAGAAWTTCCRTRSCSRTEHFHDTLSEINPTALLLRGCVAASHSLMRSAIQCIRGARSRAGFAVRSPPPMDLISAESHLN